MGTGKDFALWNNALSVEERLDAVVSELTLGEKLHCLTTGIPDIDRLGIKASFVGGEAAHGIQARHDQAFDAGEPEPTTSFTQPIGMSGSFDTELIHECKVFIGLGVKYLLVYAIHDSRELVFVFAEDRVKPVREIRVHDLVRVGLRNGGDPVR